MKPAYNEKPVPDQLFLSADVHYDQMKNHLTSQDFSTKSEADIERWVHVEYPMHEPHMDTHISGLQAVLPQWA